MTGLRLPYHRGTTGNLAGLYPFGFTGGPATTGVLIGTDGAAGWAPFCWDPFEAYAAGLVTNPNVWVLGEVGSRKSTLVKTFLWRMSALFPERWVAVLDPKGEYRGLAEAMGLTVVRFEPGGTTRVNPLAAGPRADDDGGRRTARVAAMVTALAGSTLSRALAPDEDAIVYAAVADTLAVTGEPTLGDVAARLFAPTPEMADRVRQPADRVADAARSLAYALDRLLARDLTGMFDGPSSVTVAGSGPGVVVDLSGVHRAPDAFAVVLVAAAAWLTELMVAPGPQRLQVLDEAWAALADRHTAGYLQACFKLSRAYGVANIGVAHRASDPAAQADDGTATAKIAAGLLADAATKVIYRQTPEQAAVAARLFGLTEPERDLICRLAPGGALWVIGDQRAVVHHRLVATEAGLCDTDQRMRRRPQRQELAAVGA